MIINEDMIETIKNYEYKNDKIKEGEMSVEALQRKRAEELANLKI